MKKVCNRILCIALSGILFFMPLMTSSSTYKTISWENKITCKLQEILATATSSEKIPVFIWMQDIDQEDIEQKVQKRTGITRENVSVITENMSDELAEKVASLENNVSSSTLEEFNEYYTRTEAKRTLENVRANTYISARREISREKYILNNGRL